MASFAWQFVLAESVCLQTANDYDNYFIGSSQR